MTVVRNDPAKGQPGAGKTTRRVWKKRTPVEVVLDQEQKLRQDITQKEEEITGLKRQLQKFEQARKIFETA